MCAACCALQAQVAELKDTYHAERQKGDALLEQCDQLKAQVLNPKPYILNPTS